MRKDHVEDREQANGATERKIRAGFAVALACLVVIGIASYLSVLRLTENESWVRHTDGVIVRLQSLQSALAEAQSAVGGYVITGDAAYLGAYRQAAQAVGEGYQNLRSSTSDNAGQQQQLIALAPLLDAHLAELRSIIDLRQTQSFEAAQGAILGSQGQRRQAEIARTVERMRATEESLLSERERRTKRSTSITLATIIGGGGLALVLVGLALGAIRRDFAGRRRADQALRAANEMLERRVQERTADLERAHESLRQNEKRFRAYVSATTDVIYRMSPDWSEMRQLQGQEFLADTTDANHGWLNKYIYPDDQSNVMRVIREAIRTKSTFELEHRVRRADGTVGWTFSRAIPLLDAGGQIIEWFGAASDVTDRKQTELKLQSQLARLDLLSQVTRAIGERQDVQSIFQVVIRTLVGDLPVDFCCVCIYEAADNCLTVTRVGVQSESLAMDLSMPEQARIDVNENGLSRCMRGQVVYEPDLHQNSGSFPQRLAREGLASMVAAPLVVESAVFGVLIVARIQPHSFSSGECEFLRQVSEHVALATHQVQLYQALQRAYEDLRQTQQAVMQQERLTALGTMASGVAHDINNAISPIAIYTESLLERATELTPQTRGNLQVIQTAIDDVAQTVARMREFYRPRELDQRLVPVDLNHLVSQVIELTRARWSDMAQQRGTVVEVLTDLAPDLPPIQGVQGELRDALTNLIFNALDAMPSGGQIRMRTRMTTAEGELREGAVIQLEVQDSGSGMDEQTRRRCLEPFFTTKGERGTGLGLAMVYGTLQRHDADIAIESAVGEGTTVRVSFPVPAAPGADAATTEVVRIVPSLRILLVDDDPLVLKSVRDTLVADGHEVTAAEGGQAGIDAFMAARAGKEGYQVVITDLGMPYVDGRKVASTVKSAAPGTLLLLLTGWGQQLLESAERPPHVDGVLSKPPRLRELRRALARFSGKPRRNE